MEPIPVARETLKGAIDGLVALAECEANEGACLVLVQVKRAGRDRRHTTMLDEVAAEREVVLEAEIGVIGEREVAAFGCFATKPAGSEP
jgi:hypothetical protein